MSRSAAKSSRIASPTKSVATAAVSGSPAATSSSPARCASGSPANRARLLAEVVDAAAEEWAADRIGVRISPVGAFNGVEDPAGEATGLLVAELLAERGIAYLHLSEPDWVGGESFTDGYRERLREAFPGVIVAAGSYTREKAERDTARYSGGHA